MDGCAARAAAVFCGVVHFRRRRMFPSWRIARSLRFSPFSAVVVRCGDGCFSPGVASCGLGCAHLGNRFASLVTDVVRGLVPFFPERGRPRAFGEGMRPSLKMLESRTRVRPGLPFLSSAPKESVVSDFGLATLLRAVYAAARRMRREFALSSDDFSITSLLLGRRRTAPCRSLGRVPACACMRNPAPGGCVSTSCAAARRPSLSALLARSRGTGRHAVPLPRSAARGKTSAGTRSLAEAALLPGFCDRVIL